MQRFGSVLVDHFPQDISIRVRGEGVLQFQGNAPSKELGPDVMPDPVEAFVEGVRFGMLGGSKQPPWGGRAEVLEKKVDLAKLEQHWLVRLAGVDQGALRVLANLLRARPLDEVSLVTTLNASTSGARFLTFASLKYPKPYEKLPFEFRYEEPVSSKNRVIQVVFRTPPSEDAVEELVAALQKWNMLLLGGYPDQDQEPSESGAFGDEPFQLDEVTVEQSFPDIFDCAEAAFHAMVNHVCVVHRQSPVAAVVVE